MTGAATALHYSLPDLVADRRTRGWVKVGTTAVAVAASLPEVRRTWPGGQRQQAADGAPSLAQAFRALPAARKAVALAPLVAVAGVTAGWLAVVERWIFRRGQARAAAGKRLPHTGPALAYGAVAGAMWFIEPPADRR
ncbi:hypothetical protein [Blastococcus sp. TF02A-35]|uniref:hypothetical protein n=1 Tax=Blastococcus sp. TF02A-35 TaxID=2559612 RepID=UPI0010744AE2|nr:hypothetical protein [Blastococcus sp. TF02A_35]TFV49551.1 hypothetical protein E4P43_11930 [Blastococcus sp. TF02A_35]